MIAQERKPIHIQNNVQIHRPKCEVRITQPLFRSEEYDLPKDTKIDGRIVHKVRIVQALCGDIYEYI